MEIHDFVVRTYASLADKGLNLYIQVRNVSCTAALWKGVAAL